MSFHALDVRRALTADWLILQPIVKALCGWTLASGLSSLLSLTYFSCLYMSILVPIIQFN